MPWSAAHSGETYRLGDSVTVKLVEAAPVAGALRFELLSQGRARPAKPRPAPRSRSAARKRAQPRPHQRKQRKAR